MLMAFPGGDDLCRVGTRHLLVFGEADYEEFGGVCGRMMEVELRLPDGSDRVFVCLVNQDHGVMELGDVPDLEWKLKLSPSSIRGIVDRYVACIEGTLNLTITSRVRVLLVRMADSHDVETDDLSGFVIDDDLREWPQ